MVQSEQAKRFVQAAHYHHLTIAEVQLALRVLAIELVDFVLRGHEDSILARIYPKLPAALEQLGAWYGEDLDAS